MAPTEAQRRTLKAQQLAGTKTPKARVQRYLQSTDPQLRERGKDSLLLTGIKASAQMRLVLQELRAMQAPRAKFLSKRNQIVPFDADGQRSLEFLATKNDCSLFAVASHNKKRPNNLILGRTFDRQVLDMVELGVLRFKSMRDYGGQVPKKRIGSKPLMLFCGPEWQQHSAACPDYVLLQNLLVDFYRGDVVDKIVLTGVDHVIVFTLGRAGADRTLIHQRTYFCKLQKSDAATTTSTAAVSAASPHPIPHLRPCGPDFDFVLRRTQWAVPDLYKAARMGLASAGSNKKKKNKNHSTNVFGETIGRLHLKKQELSAATGRKSKSLRLSELAQRQAEGEAVEAELERERQELERMDLPTEGPM